VDNTKTAGNRVKPELSSHIIYPGLFQPTGIAFELLEVAIVTITITDAEGTILATPVLALRFEKGTHEVFFPLPTRSAGPLYYGITAEGAAGTVTERKVLISDAR
jgi:hypothetical protein